MKSTTRFKILSITLVLAYLLSACSGAAPQSASQPVTQSGSGKPQGMEVAFTGTVEAIGTGEITVSGQVVSLDAATILDQNIQVGDIVKVEAQVSDTGAVLALKVESFSMDDISPDSSNANDATSAADNTNTSTNDNANSNDNSNSAGGTEEEIVGVVEAITADSVTIDGVTYNFGSFTEIDDAVFVGDEVKLELIVNADGTFTVREIKQLDDNMNGNDNSNDDDDNGNDDNSNDDDDDDEDDDDNSNDDDDDDDDDDDNSNNSGNGNGG